MLSPLPADLVANLSHRWVVVTRGKVWVGVRCALQLKERAKPPVKVLVEWSAVLHEVNQGERASRVWKYLVARVAGIEADRVSTTYTRGLASLLGEFGWGGTSVKR